MIHTSRLPKNGQIKNEKLIQDRVAADEVETAAEAGEKINVHETVEFVAGMHENAIMTRGERAGAKVGKVRVAEVMAVEAAVEVTGMAELEEKDPQGDVRRTARAIDVVEIVVVAGVMEGRLTVTTDAMANAEEIPTALARRRIRTEATATAIVEVATEVVTVKDASGMIAVVLTIDGKASAATSRGQLKEQVQ